MYIDNLLNSVKDVQTAIRLLYNIKRMYASGDFKQTKKNGNGVELFQLVTKTERRKSVKNVDLSYGVKPRVKRIVKKFQLGLTVDLGEKPFKRREILLLISKN